MKKNLSFILLLLMSFHAANAQTFATLWKQVETAQQKDMPQSQIAALNQIIDKAKATKSYGHLLKAGLLRIEARQEISRDSLKGDIAQFSREAAQTKSTQPVLHAVYCMLLGRIYQNYYIERINTQDSTKYYFKQAMAQPELLAGVQADSYEPLTIKGIDSGIFHNDLLHVIGIETNHYAALYRYYTAHNNRAAACISAALMMQQQADEETVSARKSRNLQKIDSLIAEYKDLEEAGELAITRYQILRSAEDVSAEEQIRYIDYALSHWGGWRRMNELRNARKELTQPSFQVSLGKEVLLPNRAHQIPILSICNISSLTMKVWRTSLKGDTGLEANNAKDYARIKKHIVSKTLYEETKRYVGLPDYKVTRDTMQLGALQPGVYLVEFSTDNKNISPERALLRVSNLYLVTQALPDKEQRLVVLNATTGEPVSNAKIRVTYRSYYQKKDIVETLTCNELGEVYAKEKKNFNMDFFIFTQDDAYGKVMGESSNFYPAYSRSVRNLTAIFTDRSIYRPGQTVHASVIAYQDLKGEDMAVAPNRKIELVLRDANYKEVERKAVTTDSYGTASADFALPRNGLTGRFSLHTAHGNASFRVEEYKRPTFKIEFEKVKQQYADGDSIQVQGTAKSFAGAPMPGVRVTYTVTRRPSYRWWFMPSGGDHRTIAQDTVVTDSKGMFKIPVKLVLPEKGKQNEARFFNFDIEVSATNAAGETQEGATSLPLSDKKTMFYAEVPEMLNKKDSLQVNFLYQNNAGENLDGTVRYRFGDTDAWQTTSANKEMRISVNHLASGRHTLTAMCENDTLTRKIILFSLDDKHVPVDTLDWFYQVENTFKADKMPARIQLGTSAAEQHIVYTVMAGNKVIEQGTLDLKNELYTHTFTYQPQYEKGIVVSYAWVKNGNLYRHEAIIACELPDKRLQLQWQTFRNRLTPGQKEEWTLRVTRPNGQARQAQVLAGMYDKSLDMITPHSFSLYSTLGLSFPQLRWWADEYSDEETLYGEQPLNLLPARSLLFTRLFNDIADDYPMGSSVKYTAPLIKSRALSKDIAFEAHASAMEKGTVADVAAENITFATKAEVSNAKTQPQTSVQVRQNLNETAFFYPNIETNRDGVATIQFTLPESVTTWKFMALAHDKEMNFGMLTDEAVAKKIVIIQPNVPRFMRQGDKGWLSAQVSNTSDRAIQGTATLQFLDAETQKVLYTKQQAYKLAAEDATTVRFEIETAQLPALVIARFTASGKDYSDGEQHYLPILSNAEWLTNTVAFTQHEPGKTTIDLAKLFPAQSTRRKLTVEYTNNPAWLVIQSLPALADAHENNAIDLASAYYANTTAAAILQSAPHIKTVFDIWRSEPAEKGSLASALQQNEELKTIILNETPWVLDADKEAKQKQLLVNFFDESQVAQRLSSQLQSLTKLQNPDGSFSWYPGMRGSFYVTLSVAETLARLQVHHLLDTPVQNMLNNAIGFLQKTV